MQYVRPPAMLSSAEMSRDQSSEFGVLVRQLRGKRGWTQEKLAREAEITVTTVSNIERGATRPTAETVGKFARAFGMKAGDLDPRLLAASVAEQAQTLARRQAIGHLLLLSDAEIDAVLQMLDERSAARGRQKSPRRTK